MFIVEKGPNQNDPNYANYLYKTEQRLLQYLKEYIKEVTNLDTILPFVNKYIHNMKKALKEAQIKSIS